MTERTTQEWEALLGRWVYDKQPGKLLGARERFGKVREQEKAAPEAVAEVVHLRREMEALRWSCLSAASAHRGAAPTARSREALESIAGELEAVARDLTRILGGDNDE